MIIELSTSTDDNVKFWERVEKTAPLYSLSDTELNKAALMFSIGIDRPRVRVTKVKVKIRRANNVVILPNNGEVVRLYKDVDGFYIQKVNWKNS